jgi:uncharacterized protein YdhG (YjbR/CyaY superfamily)
MKKKKAKQAKPHTSSKRKSSKPASSAKDVDKYLAAVPEPGCSTLKKVRTTIRSVVPTDAIECISYGIPAFKHNGMLVFYAAFKDHWSFFPGSGRTIALFKDELKSYHTSKGTLRFALDKPLPVALIKKIVKARLAENASKKSR